MGLEWLVWGAYEEYLWLSLGESLENAVESIFNDQMLFGVVGTLESLVLLAQIHQLPPSQAYQHPSTHHYQCPSQLPEFFKILSIY